MADPAGAPAGLAPGLSVVGYGMWSALGPDGPSTVAGLRAQFVASETGNLWDPTAGAWLACFRVAAHQWWSGPTFLPELLWAPIEECRAQIGRLKPETGGRRAADVPLLVTVAPSDRPGPEGSRVEIVMDGLARKCGDRLPPGSGVVAGGRIGLASLIAHAARQKAEYPLQILAGAESFLNQAVADHYLARGRLFCAANSSGFVPGEAGAALLVAPTGSVEGPELKILGLGAGQEPGRDGGSREAAVTAEGLTTALGAALAAAGRSYYDVPTMLGDLNGEHFKFKEASMATSRIDRVPPEGASRRPRGYVEHWNIIEGLGEIGAALMPAQLGWAFEAGRLGLLPQNRAVAFAGEDDGRRVAMVVEMAGGPR